MKRIRFTRIVFLIGFLIVCYPVVASLLLARSQERAVQTYQATVDEYDDATRETLFAQAEQYNEMLAGLGDAIDGEYGTTMTPAQYQATLSTTDTGIMGSLAIPKIDVELPLYHGTGDDVLAIGVGHQEWTSLPIGGENTHCVLTGHRGLPNAKLFTRLDELEEGDLFFLKVLEEVHAYQVDHIQVMTPDDAAEYAMRIEGGKDLTSLVTCTPYGINTHRLVVTGHRVPYERAKMTHIRSNIPSMRELIFLFLPIGIGGAVVISGIVKHRNQKQLAASSELSQYSGGSS